MTTAENASTDPREVKLPRWAQDAINTLRRKVADAERRATEARLSNGPANSDTLLDPYDEVPIRLPRGEIVRFVLDTSQSGDVDGIDVRIRRNRRNGPCLELMAASGGTLVIYPQVANVVYVQIDNR